MKRTTQFTFALPNKSGQLAKVAGCLAKAKINVIALSAVELSDQSILRLVVDKPAALAKMVADCPATVTETEVLLVEAVNQVGALAKIGDRLAKKRINVNFIYGSTGRGKAKTNIVVGTRNLAAASKALARL